jgi:hypothetical protein
VTSQATAHVLIAVTAPTAENATEWATTVSDLVQAEYGGTMRLAVRVNPPAAPSAPADRAALRERIRRAVCEAEGFAWDSDMLEPDEYGDHADAVLSVLPATTDRAAGPTALREAAAFYEEVLQQSLDPDSDPRYCTAVRGIVMGLRRRADDAQYGDDSEMAASLRRDGFGEDEIGEMLRPAGKPLPAPDAHRAAILREAIARVEDPEERAKTTTGLGLGWEAARDVLRRMVDEAPCGRSSSLTGPCSAGDHCCKGPVEAQQPGTQAEDPARIDRLRPEFFEHASVESIDVQIQRAQRQQRQWGNRVQTLTILRQARVIQKECGEWPAAVSQPGKEA